MYARLVCVCVLYISQVIDERRFITISKLFCKGPASKYFGLAGHTVVSVYLLKPAIIAEKHPQTMH